MKAKYDGLQVVRIPVGNTDIFTNSNCMQNIMNIMQANVCISEHEGDDYCSEYTAERYEEYVLPRASDTDFFC